MMEQPGKVVWSEGVFLNQQHFQCWDNYNHYQQRLYHRAFNGDEWGIVCLQVDESSLENGLFRLIRCTALLKDGRWIDFNHSLQGDYLDYDLSQVDNDEISIYLSLPRNQQIQGVKGYDNPMTEAAWRGQYLPINDQYDVKRKADVLLAQPQLYLNSKVNNNHESLLIAKVKVTGSSYELCDRFIPSCLHIGASNVLMKSLRRVIEMLESKSKVLLNVERGESQSVATVGSVGYELVKLCYCLHSKLAQLEHKATCHPRLIDGLFKEFIVNLRAINQLELVTLDFYQHENLSIGWFELLSAMNTLLESAMPAPTMSLTLKRANDTSYYIDDIDSQFLQQCDIYLAVNYSGNDEAWPQRFAEQSKLSSREAMPGLLASFISGVALKHVTRLPNSIVMKPMTEYFLIQARGDYWSQIVEQRCLALTISHEFNQAAISLITRQG